MKISDIFIDNLEWDRVVKVVEEFIRTQKAKKTDR